MQHQKYFLKSFFCASCKIRFFIDFANWTIHGIAVTTVDGEAKSYCNKSIEFDQSLISPLIEDLTLAWTNDHANSPATNKLWKFEWLKHGSCGLDINPINTEFKYFSKGKSDYFRNEVYFRNFFSVGMAWKIPTV